MQAEIAVRAAPSGVPRRAVIWGVPVFVVVVFATLTALNPSEFAFGLALGVGTGTIALVGALLADRAPDNRIGTWLLVASGVLAASEATFAYATTGQAADPPWPGAAALLTLGNIPDVIAVMILLIGVPAIFPTGTLLSPRWRVLVWILIVAVLTTAVSMLVGTGQGADPGLQTIADALSAVSSLTIGIGFIGALTSVAIRFRRGSLVEREQTKWFLAATIFAVIVMPLSFLTPKDSLLGPVVLTLALVAQPVAIGIAVLRYRLYAIDRIISRTVAYILITAVLAAVYAAVVIILRTFVDGLIGGGSAEVVISTLAVASLFQPVRRRIQSSLDHRFDRRRYDAERTVAAFSGQLRDEVHLDAVTGGLVVAVQSTVAPTASGIWLRRRTR